MRNTSLRLPALCLLALALTLPARSQGPPSKVTVPITTTSTSFDAEPFVVLSNSFVIEAKADGTGYREQTVAIKIQSDAALRQLGIVSTSFASASEHVEFHYVRVRRPDGSVLETNVADAIEEAAPVTREAPLYSDLKEKEIPVKNLHVGDTLEWQARVIRTTPEAPGHFWGQHTFTREGGIVLSEEFELRVPASATVNVWNNPASGISPSSTVQGAERVYHWKSANLKPTVGPQAEAAKKTEETRVLTADEETDATDGKLPSLAWTTFTDWAAVGTWYRSLEATRTTPDDSIKAKVAELTAGKISDEDKARALYAYVSSQIRYIGVDFGIGRYQPHTASEVLTNQYGDCKDKHTLLAAMLSAAGIRADAVLIGAGLRFNQAVPSPEAFNHLISLAYIGGSGPDHAVWLDATAGVAPFSALFPAIRDKFSLVVPDAGTAHIERTPAALPFPGFSTSVAKGTLDKDLNSDSQFVLTFHDDDEIGLRQVLQQVSAAQYPEFVQRMMGGFGFGGTTSEASIDHVQDTSQPLTIAFYYHRTHNPDWGADRVTVAFLPILIPVVDDKKPPVSTIHLGSPRTETSTVDLQLPQGATAELPEAIHAKSAFANCDVTYRLDHANLHAERRLTVLQEKVPVANWKVYKTWYDDCSAGSVPYVTVNVSATSPSGKASSNTTVISSSSTAAKLIADANTAISNRDTAKARSLLDQARDLNAEQRNLWGTYGYLAYELGMPLEAIDNYRKELKLHPDQTWVYAPLATELARTGKNVEALSTLRTGVTADPASLRLNLALVSMLSANGDFTGAIEAGNAALKLLPADDPKNADLVNAIATAQVDAHAMSDAAELLLPALKNVTTPLLKNNLAYTLSQTGLHLDEAEAAERSALDTLTNESASWTLDEAPGTLKQASSLLVSSWDSLGYILFRQGHLAEARNYLEASWHVRQASEVGMHLGDVLLALNDPATALKTYELARAALPSQPPATKEMPKSTIPAQLKLIADKIDAGIARAEAAGAKPDIFDGRAQLQKMRTFPISGTGHQHRVIEYRVLVSNAKVERTSAGGTSQPADADPYFKSVQFPGFVPANSPAKIVLSGFVNCAAATCEFIAEP